MTTSCGKIAAIMRLLPAVGSRRLRAPPPSEWDRLHVVSSCTEFQRAFSAHLFSIGRLAVI